MKNAKIRLYVNCPLQAGQAVGVTEQQANYLFNVMRLPLGAVVLLFNGLDGEWHAEVEKTGRRGGVLIARAQTAPLRLPPDIWLLFAPIKKARTDFIVEKAVEMGAARICPVQTQYTNADRFRREKLSAHAMEAAEQCGATAVPQVDDLTTLDKMLATWPQERLLFWADEALAGKRSEIIGNSGTPSAILIGPEGGFSTGEQDRLRALPFVRPFSLGPRILRADTAAVAALTLWQAAMGDWT